MQRSNRLQWLLIGLLIFILSVPGWSVRQNILDILGKEQRFEYRISDAHIGDLLCRYEALNLSDNEEGYSVHSLLTLLNAEPHLVFESTLQVRADGSPVRYELEVRQGDEVQSVTCRIEKGEIIAEGKARGQTIVQKVKTGEPPSHFILDNNMIGHWAILAALQGWGKDTVLNLKAFVPQTLGEQAFEVKWLDAQADEKHPEKKYQRFSVEPIQEVFYFDLAGKLVRIEEPRQNLVIQQVESQQ